VKKTFGILLAAKISLSSLQEEKINKISAAYEIYGAGLSLKACLFLVLDPDLFQKNGPDPASGAGR